MSTSSETTVRYMTGYQFYVKEQMPIVKANSTIESKDRLKHVIATWHSLSEVQKTEYKAKAKAANVAPAPVKEQVVPVPVSEPTEEKQVPKPTEEKVVSVPEPVKEKQVAPVPPCKPNPFKEKQVAPVPPCKPNPFKPMPLGKAPNKPKPSFPALPVAQ
jgi:hypothetical protein